MVCCIHAVMAEKRLSAQCVRSHPGAYGLPFRGLPQYSAETESSTRRTGAQRHHDQGCPRVVFPRLCGSLWRPPRGRPPPSRGDHPLLHDALGGVMMTSSASGALRPVSARLVGRFASGRHRFGFWAALWVALAVAEIGALAPVLTRSDASVEPLDIVSRLVGCSFAVCGLIAWRGRPDNHSGRLMTATGLASLAGPLLLQFDDPLAQTLGLLLVDVWAPVFVALVLTFLTGGRLRTTMDRVLVGAALVQPLLLIPLELMFTAREGNLVLLVADPRLAAATHTAQRVGYLVVFAATAAVIATRWAVASRPGRRALLPGLAGAACLVLLSAVMIVDLVAGARSDVLFFVAISSLAVVPVAFLAGLLRSRLARGGVAELFRGLRTMQPGELQAALARSLGDPELLVAYPVGESERDFVDDVGRPVSVPDPGDDRSIAVVERDGGGSPSWCTTGPSTRIPSSSRRRAPRRPSRWRTGCCTRRSMPASRRCGRRGSGSLPLVMPSGAASSAICTTAPSSAWSPWPCSCR